MVRGLCFLYGVPVRTVPWLDTERDQVQSKLVLPAIAGGPPISVQALLQVAFDATMLLAQEYRSMIARAKQRSVQALTALLQKVSSHPCSSMLLYVHRELRFLT